MLPRTAEAATAPLSEAPRTEPAEAGRPRWAMPALFGIIALAGALYAWHIGEREYQPFYGIAARAMSGSWKAFLFGAVDPSASTITIDKIPGFLWPQALSARVFGFHAWSLVLPQVIEGMLAAAVVYVVVRRWRGTVAGLTAAALFTVTPVAVSLFGLPGEDSALLLCTVLAVEATQRAVRGGRLAPLVLAGFWVGAGFQMKMLQSWVILPALVVAYLVAAPIRLRTRWAHIAVAGVVTLVVSLSWVVLVALVPAANRPYLDGTTNNNPFSMVFVYNGLGRFGPFQQHIGSLGSVPITNSSAGLSAVGQSGGISEGWGKLFDASLASQAGWLYVFAAVALVCGLAWTRRAPRTDAVRAGYLLHGIWVGLLVLVFSAGLVPHTSYVAALAPGLAGLTAAGLVDLVAAYRERGAKAYALPVAVGLSTVWACSLTSQYDSFASWLTPALGALGAAAVLLLVVPLLTGRGKRLVAAGVAASALAVAGAPAVWSLSAVDAKYAGNTFDAQAGPPMSDARIASLAQLGATGQVLAQVTSGGNSTVQKFLFATMLGSTDSLSPAQQSRLDYVTGHGQGAQYLFATDSWTLASPYLLTSDSEILTMGGFGADAPYPAPPALSTLVAQGRVRYFLLGAKTAQQPGSAAGEAGAWVRKTCVQVPSAVLQDGPQDQQLFGALYDCAKRAPATATAPR
jgi:4-amino-4-deoxy-L-arabinose transferase-like glycosyltransferase